MIITSGKLISFSNNQLQSVPRNANTIYHSTLTLCSAENDPNTYENTIYHSISILCLGGNDPNTYEFTIYHSMLTLRLGGNDLNTYENKCLVLSDRPDSYNCPGQGRMETSVTRPAYIFFPQAFGHFNYSGFY